MHHLHSRIWGCIKRGTHAYGFFRNGGVGGIPYLRHLHEGEIVQPNKHEEITSTQLIIIIPKCPKVVFYSRPFR